MDLPLDPGADLPRLHWGQINQNEMYAKRVWQKLCSNDPSLEELYVGQTHGFYPRGGLSWGELGTAIGNSKHLKDLSVSVLGPGSRLVGNDDRATGEDIEELFKGIAKNRSIVDVYFFGGDLLGGRVFTLVTPLLKRRVLQGVGLQTTEALEDDVIQMLSSALTKTASIWGKRLSFYAPGLPLNAEGGVGLIRALSALRLSLDYLDLRFGEAMDREAFAVLSSLLQYNSVVLESLWLNYNGLDDECAALLAKGLVGNSGRKYNYKLKQLDLSGNRNITSTGWRSIFGALQRKESKVTNLWLDNTSVFEGDCLFDYLRGSCRLTTLGLTQCDVDDEIMSSLAHCLVGNRTLRKLELYDNPALTNNGWSTLTTVLCNGSSIEDTFSSNHTLETVITDVDVPPTFAHALKVNEKNCDTDAARLKILQSHFRSAQGLTLLYKLERKMWPHAMAWMAREESEFSLLFWFLRGAAGMIEWTATSQNRRRRVVARMRNALSSRSSRIVKRG